MIPWIQVYSNLLSHPKTTRLADELCLKSGDVDPDVVAVGILISLWTWAVQNAYDGDLSKCSARAIAGACKYKRKPEALLDALRAAGWIDQDMRLHDWEEYALLLIDAEENRKANDRKRAKEYRDRKRDNRACVTLPSRDACTENTDERHVTIRENHAPTIPDLTIPDPKNQVSASRVCVSRLGARADAHAHAGTREGEGADDGFERFWTAYPRKSGDIRGAYMAYAAALEAGATAETILSALEWQSRQSAWAENGGQFIPSPEKWLRNRGWEQQKPEAAPEKQSTTFADVFERMQT